jgi:hypothetical protein
LREAEYIIPNVREPSWQQKYAASVALYEG